jgi:hypothetical protein
MTRRRGTLVAAVAVLLAVTGCTTSGVSDGPSAPASSAAGASTAPSAGAADPTGTPVPAPAPVADPLADVDTIVFSAASLSLRARDVEVASVPLVGEPLDDAVAVLSRVLGEPVADGVEEDHCVAAQTRWAWGEVRLGTADLYADEGSLVFRAEQPTVSAPDGREVRIETPGGVAVGDPVGPLATQVPLEDQDAFDPDGTGRLSLVVDRVRTRESAGEMYPYGALVWSEGGTVLGLAGPGELKDQC